MSSHKIHPNTTVLVLNSSYEPIHITKGKRAIVLLLKEKAQALSNRVIRLLSYIKIPFSKIISQKPSRAMIYKRDGYKCMYCGSTKKLTIDHVIPRSKGGTDDWNNLTCACSHCNTKKSDKLLEHTGMKLIKQPRAPHSKIEFALYDCEINEWKEYVN
jgi:hypothetical protein